MTATVKGRHRATWASGDYPAIAAEVASPLGPILVKAAGIGPGQTVLDVAAGDPQRTAAPDAELLTLGERFDLGDGVMNREHLLWTASRQPPAGS